MILAVSNQIAAQLKIPILIFLKLTIDSSKIESRTSPFQKFGCVRAKTFHSPNCLNLLVLLTESLFHLSAKSLEGSIGVGQLVLGVLEGVLGVPEGGSKVVSLSSEGSIGGSQVVDASVGVLQSIVGLTKLVCAEKMYLINITYKPL